MAAKAHQTADKVALQGGVCVQAAVCVIALQDQRPDVGFAQAAARAGGAVFQRGVLHHAGHAAEELPQHTALALGIALIARQRIDAAGIVEVVQLWLGAGLAADVARNAARADVAVHIGRIVKGAYRAVLLQRKYTKHTAHADGAVDACFACRGQHLHMAGVLGLFGVGVCGSLGAVVHPQTRHGDAAVCRKIFQCCIFGGDGTADQPADAEGFLGNFAVRVFYAGVGGGSIVKGQRCRHARGRRAVFAALDGAVFHSARGHAAQSAHRADIVAVVGVGVGVVFVQQGKVQPARRDGVCVGRAFGCHVDQHIGVGQRQVFDGAAVFAHQADVAAAVLGHRRPAQLQACDGVAVAVQRDVFFQLQQAGPRHGAVGRRGLGGGLAAVHAVHHRRTAEPVKVLGQLGGQYRLALVPAQVVQMAEILQRCRIVVELAEVGVLGVALLGLAVRVRGHAVGAGGGRHLGADVRGVRDKAGDAEQLALGDLRFVRGGLQDSGVVHGVQRQDKVAVGVADREGIVDGFFFCAVRVIKRYRQGSLGARGLGDNHREQLFVGVLLANFNGVACIGLVAFGVAAPAQGQRFAVGQVQVAHAQLGLLQIDHIDRILGAVVAHQRFAAAVGVAAVVQRGAGGVARVVGKAQCLGSGIIKGREHLPRAAVDLNAEGGIGKGFVADVVFYVFQQGRLGAALGRCGALVKIKRVDACVQGGGLFGGHIPVQGLRDMPVAARCADLLGKPFFFPCHFQLRHGQLGGLEHGAGVGFIFLEPCQADISNQAAPHKGSQNSRYSQHHHKLHQRKAAAVPCVLVTVFQNAFSPDSPVFGNFRYIQRYYNISTDRVQVRLCSICELSVNFCRIRHFLLFFYRYPLKNPVGMSILCIVLLCRNEKGEC